MEREERKPLEPELEKVLTTVQEFRRRLAESVTVTELLKKVGEKLRERREALGLTLSDVETLTGIRTTTLFRYEKGQSDPRLSSLYKLSQLYNCSLLDLLPEEEGE